MAKAILNNVIQAGHEEEAVRDGWYVRHPDRLVVTQKALAAFLRHRDQMERLASIIRDALNKGGDVEAGSLVGGLWEESSKAPNWRQEFIGLGGDAQGVLDRTQQKESVRLRVYDPAAEEKPRGHQVAPAAPAQAAADSGDTGKAAAS